MRIFKNLLVTGGAGFIGSHFIDALLKEKEVARVVNLDLLTYASNVQVVDDSRYFFVKGDILDKEFVKSLLKEHEIDTIVHFAAESHVDNSIFSPSSFIETNIRGTFSLLETVRGTSIHFHHVSTDEVYGSLGKEGFFTENSQYRPNSPYSASKASSDHLVRAYGNTYQVLYTMSHCSNNFGPRQHKEKLIPLAIKNLMAKKALPIYGRGENVRDWIYVEDHVEALLTILKLGKSSEVYDIGGGKEFSNLDLIRLLISVFAKETSTDESDYIPLITFVEDRMGHDFRYAIDPSKIRAELGFSPRHDIHEGLTSTVRWYLNAN